MIEKKHEDDTRPLSVEETAELLGATVIDDIVVQEPIAVPFIVADAPPEKLTFQFVKDDSEDYKFNKESCCVCGKNIPVDHSALFHKDGRIACCGCEGALKNEELIDPSQMTANMLARVFDCSVNEDGTVTIDPRNFNESYSITIISRDKPYGKITTTKLAELASCLPDNELKRALTWAADRITSLETKLKGLQVKP